MMDVNLKIILCGLFLSVVMPFITVHAVKIAKVPQQMMAILGSAKKKVDAQAPGKTPGADILHPTYQKPSLDEPGMPISKKALSVILDNIQEQEVKTTNVGKTSAAQGKKRNAEKQDEAATATWADIFPHSRQKAFPDPEEEEEKEEEENKDKPKASSTAQQAAEEPEEKEAILMPVRRHEFHSKKEEGSNASALPQPNSNLQLHSPPDCPKLTYGQLPCPGPGEDAVDLGNCDCWRCHKAFFKEDHNVNRYTCKLSADDECGPLCSGIADECFDKGKQLWAWDGLFDDPPGTNKGLKACGT